MEIKRLHKLAIALSSGPAHRIFRIFQERGFAFNKNKSLQFNIQEHVFKIIQEKYGTLEAALATEKAAAFIKRPNQTDIRTVAVWRSFLAKLREPAQPKDVIDEERLMALLELADSLVELPKPSLEIVPEKKSKPHPASVAAPSEDDGWVLVDELLIDSPLPVFVGTRFSTALDKRAPVTSPLAMPVIQHSNQQPVTAPTPTQAKVSVPKALVAPKPDKTETLAKTVLPEPVRRRAAPAPVRTAARVAGSVTAHDEQTACTLLFNHFADFLKDLQQAVLKNGAFEMDTPRSLDALLGSIELICYITAIEKAEFLEAAVRRLLGDEKSCVELPDVVDAAEDYIFYKGSYIKTETAAELDVLQEFVDQNLDANGCRQSKAYQCLKASVVKAIADEAVHRTLAIKNSPALAVAVRAEP